VDTYELPDAIEPDYWNVVFHPATTWHARLFVGQFQHVSAFTYVPGFKAWIVYDVQWGGMRIAMFAQQFGVEAFVRSTRDCAIVKFTRSRGHMPIASRLGFYCVPAIKHLLGLPCVAVTPDQLYRALINNGGIRIDAARRATPTAAGSDAPAGAGASAG
jgi:hypothetical protein